MLFAPDKTINNLASFDAKFNFWNSISQTIFISLGGLRIGILLHVFTKWWLMEGGHLRGVVARREFTVCCVFHTGAKKNH